MIDLQGGAVPTISAKLVDLQNDVHFSEIYNLLLLGRWIRLHYSEWGSNAQCTVEDIDTQNNRVSFTECSDDFESTGPHSLGSSIFTFCLCDLFIVLLELVEQVVDDISYTTISSAQRCN